MYFTDTEGYKDRKRVSLLWIVIFSALTFLLATAMSDWTYGLGFAAFLFAVQYFEFTGAYNYYILSLTICDGQLELVYNDQTEKKSVKDDAALFKFKKKSAFSKTRVTYMNVYYKEALLLKQDESGEWTENKFDEVLATTNE